MAYTNNDILDLVNFTIRKENKGFPLTRQSFTLLLDTHGLEYYEQLYDQYERTNEVSDSLRRFKTTKTGAQLSFTGNTIDIPTDYAHSGYLYYKKDGTDPKPVNIVDDDTFMMMQDSVLDEPTESYPIARFTNGYIEYLPTTLDQNNFTFSYLAYPSSPYYDYYIDTNGVLQYLGAGTTHNFVSGEFRSDGSEVSASGSYSSLTVELDFNEEDKLKVAYRILRAVGVPIDEAGVYQYAQQLSQES